MSMQAMARELGVVCLVVTCLLAPSARAQSPNVEKPLAATPLTAAPVEPHSVPSQTTTGVTDDIWILLNSVSDRVDTAISRATEAKEQATEASNQAGEMVDNMHDGLENLTGEMQARIQDAVQAVQQAVLDELAGATDFTNGANSCSSECEAFRDQLVTLLTSIQDISNALLATSGINGQADFTAEIDFIDSLSGKALYPLYRVLQTLPVLDQDFLDSMSEIAGDLNELAPYIADAVEAVGALDVCRTLADNDKLVERLLTVAKNINKVAKGSKTAGSVLKAVGKTKIGGRVGAWGFAGISYTGGLLERFGELLKSLGDRLAPKVEKLERKLQYCVLKVNEEVIIGAVDANHQQVVQSQQAILDAVKALQAGRGADLNGDGIVDLADYSMFQNLFGSPVK